MPKSVVAVKDIERLAKLLRAKSEDMAKRSEKNDTRKGFYQAGKAEAFYWACEHLENLAMLDAFDVES